MSRLGILDLMLPAFAECLVLVGIHSYLGLHVIRRKVIFVDLALAQVAALGTTIGFLFGMAPDSTAALIFSMLFAFVGAAIFSVTRLRGDKIPQEAIIGLVYAIAAAVVILVVDRAPHGAEHIKEVMTGSILWVRWSTIGLAAVAYLGVGLFHYVFRRQFILISDDPETAYRSGMSVRWWDFLFYLSFGVVISISVQTAGVLLVFVFLVVPAITATLITDRIRLQLVIGWTVGTLVSLIGLSISYWGDMPSGPTVVAFYGATLVVMALFLFVFKATERLRALGRLGIGLAAATGTGAGLIAVGSLLGQSSLAAGRVHAGGATHEHHDRLVAPRQEEPHQAVALLRALEGKGEAEQDQLLTSIDAAHHQILVEAFRRSEDDLVRLAIATHLARHDAAHAACMFAEVLQRADNPFVRSEVITALETTASRRFGLDPDQELSRQEAAHKRLERWLASKGCRP